MQNKQRQAVEQEWRVLNRWQLAVYNCGGVLMVIGAFAYATVLFRAYAWALYTIGVIAFAVMQSYACYWGENLQVKRLRRQQLFSCFLLLLSALALMFWHFGWLMALGNAWLVLLVVATVYQVYTAFRIPAVMKRTP